MNKADKILILIILLAAVCTYVPIYFSYGKEAGDIAVVRYRNEEVLRLDLHQNGIYHVKGTNGTVAIEVKDGAVAVIEENSPYHLCSLQGFVSSGAEPIICLPNEIVISIEADDGDVDVVMQ
ncbi:NusG domain II-containing protein [Massilicoli timonensis]|uniref:NusG domain II-containing protein n=1 Tax=Massilicoli timonensis TaxID=2015901 RepID=A0ABT1SJR6_9FIRM|nr:NusG domain II-containing protein [Massilicoli timonensis]MCQ5121467.1 NusG domain II-containing protein [Massilicoli timonensis]